MAKSKNKNNRPVDTTKVDSQKSKDVATTQVENKAQETKTEADNFDAQLQANKPASLALEPRVDAPLDEAAAAAADGKVTVTTGTGVNPKEVFETTTGSINAPAEDIYAARAKQISDAEQATAGLTQALVMAPAHEVSANPALVDYPQDPWGITRDVKTAIQELASRVKGQADKKAVADSVLSVAMAHFQAKFLVDHKEHTRRHGEGNLFNPLDSHEQE